MFSNKSNIKLGIILTVLIVIVTIMFVTDGKNERTFKENLVDIDTSKISEISIYSKAHGEVKLLKTNNLWKVKLTGDKSSAVPESKMISLFNQLLEIKPKRLAARNENKWKDFKVDSSGTRVIVKEGGNTSLDLIIGRFAFQQPRTMNTYVRLFNDVDVYEVDGFLQATFNQDANSFRDGRILGYKTKNENWKNLEFTYPADSSFQLVKLENRWRTVKYSFIDSAKTAQYLNQLSNLSSSEFIDDINPENLISPDNILKITNENNVVITISAYKKNDKIIITSSANPESLFNGNENELMNKIFIGESSLILQK